MTSQQTLDGRPAPDAGLWRNYITDGAIDHHAWMRACANGQWVGTCPRCGDYLAPERPDDRGSGRTDYTARCRNPWQADGSGASRTVTGCGYEMVAPGGRINTGTATTRQRRKGA